MLYALAVILVVLWLLGLVTSYTMGGLVRVLRPGNFMFVTLLLIMASYTSLAQNPLRFRSGIFLHHSTGANIWGPNASLTSVPQEIAVYNLQHGLVGADSVSLGELGYPYVYDNEWATWHQLFDNELPGLDPFLQNNRIVVVKSCFPSSNISGIGTPSDTLAPFVKTVYNFKWHWRSIVSVMRQHPENFFVTWTNAPLVAGTNAVEAALSNSACRWAKDTLATGMDSEFGVFPRNVYVFDYFHKLANSAGFLPLQYAWGPDDSHPNAAATALVAPQLVREVFDASMAYEDGVLPIGLSSFTATLHENGYDIRLAWTTLTETNNYGFFVERRAASEGTFHELSGSFIPGHGTTIVPQYYSFVDSTASPGHWYYRLRQVDLDGSFHYTDAIAVSMLTNVGSASVTESFSLSQNYPNPFNPTTEIRYQISEAGDVTLKIYDLLGREVKTLVNENLTPGSHETTFDAAGLSSGVYYYTLAAKNSVATKKLLLLR